jgi:energy-coupling factor transporter transmembrane protein EcfT
MASQNYQRSWPTIVVLSGILVVWLAFAPYSGGTEKERVLAWCFISLLAIALIGAVLGRKWIFFPLAALWVAWIVINLSEFLSNPRENWGNMAIGVIALTWTGYSLYQWNLEDIGKEGDESVPPRS